MQSGRLPRYLGLDIGNRRIGVAVSDELGLTAQPVLTLERRTSRREDLRSLARLCRRFGVAGIVVGNPLHLSGEPSPQAAKNQFFAEELGELTGLPIHLWDERLTSREAHQNPLPSRPPAADASQGRGPGGGDVDLAEFLGRTGAGRGKAESSGMSRRH